MKIEIELDEYNIEKIIKQSRGISFSKSLQLLRNEAGLLRSRYKQRFPSFLLDSKLITHEFAKKINVNSPQIYQVDEKLCDIKFRDKVVIKPMYENQSVGVFICHDSNNIDYLKDNKKFNNFLDAQLFAEQLLNDGIVRQDKWMSEQLITMNNGIARDIKFYMFYGQVGLILESSRYPSLTRCWYDENFNIIKTGKYDKNLFQGDASNLNNLKELAKFISLELPVPFIRIDFLTTPEGTYLGELTPVPSGYKNFNNHIDLLLGDFYHRANTRLAYDVSLGKRFDNYWSLVKSESEIINNIRKKG